MHAAYGGTDGFMSSLLAETFDSYDPDVNKGYTVDLGASAIGTISGLGPLLVQLSGIYISGGMALSGKDSGLNIWQRLGLAAIADLSRNIKLDEHFKTIDYPFFLGGDYSYIYRLLKLFKQN